MANIKSLFLVFSALVAPLALAATSSSSTAVSPAAPSGTTATQVSAPSSSGVRGLVDFRPSAALNEGEKNQTHYRLETTLEAGYNFNKSVSLTYDQDIWQNVGTTDPKFAGTMHTVLHDGYTRLRVNNIYQNGRFSFGYENRLYVPTDEGKRNAGLIVGTRNYFKFAYQASNALTIHLWEVPIPFAYDKSGTGKSANPYLENRVYLIADASLFGGKISAALPFIWHMTGYRKYSIDAKKSGKTQQYVWIYPEVMYNVNSNLAVGVSYYSDNLVDAKFKKFTIGDGLKKGVPQLALTAKL